MRLKFEPVFSHCFLVSMLLFYHNMYASLIITAKFCFIQFEIVNEVVWENYEMKKPSVPFICHKLFDKHAFAYVRKCVDGG